MLGVRGGVDLLALVVLVYLVLLGDLHGGHDLTGLFAYQRHFFAVLDALGLSLGGGAGDGDGPEGAVCHLELGAYAFPVVVAHEALKRGEPAYAHHNKVAHLA